MSSLPPANRYLTCFKSMKCYLWDRVAYLGFTGGIGPISCKFPIYLSPIAIERYKHLRDWNYDTPKGYTLPILPVNGANFYTSYENLLLLSILQLASTTLPPVLQVNEHQGSGPSADQSLFIHRIFSTECLQTRCSFVLIPVLHTLSTMRRPHARKSKLLLVTKHSHPNIGFFKPS